jgi:membrane protein DedA with SNARE-associated domain
MAHILEQIRLIIEEIILGLGYPGIGFVMFSENVFPPIPSELVMPFAGFLIAEGEMDFVLSMVAGTLGALAGAVVLYYLGVWADERLIRNFVRRYGKFFLLSEADLDTALDYFERYGKAVVFFGRLIPIIRSLISVPAGMNRMPLGIFLAFTTIGTALWNLALTVGGIILGESWQEILGIVKQYETVTLIVLVALVAIFVVTRVRSMRANKPVTETDETV